MEQFLSFVAVIGLCAVCMVMGLPILFLITFFAGGVYLIVRGKERGWRWPRRP
jgi:hypothetical protein